MFDTDYRQHKHNKTEFKYKTAESHYGQTKNCFWAKVTQQAKVTRFTVLTNYSSVDSLPCFVYLKNTMFVFLCYSAAEYFNEI